MFMNSENSKTSHPLWLLLKLTNKIDLQKCEKVLLYQILVFIIYGKTKRSYNNKARAWNDKFELPDGSHSVSDISRLFWVLRENTDKKSIRIYINSIENIVTFKIRLDIILNF